MQWYTPFITMDIGLAEKVLRTIAVYLAIAILLRVAGKRLLAQMNSLDLVVVLLLSNVVQNAIIGPDNSVLGAVIGAIVLIGFDLGLDLLTQRSAGVRRLLTGTPTDLVRAGRPDQAALARVGIDDRELRLALSRRGIDDVSQVESASLEPAGALLTELKPGDRPVTRDDLAAAVAELRELIAPAR
ncbi:MAG: YetF domain-containing protein [Propionicimonas sp.]